MLLSWRGKVMKCLQQYFGCERIRGALEYAGSALTGRVQQENDRLVQRLAALRADYNQLKRDTDELLQYADRELKALKQTNTGLAQEFDDLQLRVWELEQQVDELLLYIARLVNAPDCGDDEAQAEAAIDEVPSLEHLALGIVGGHAATVREAINELSAIYGLQRWVVVPPTWEASMNKRVLKGKLEHCDLIVIVTGYMNHSLTNAVLGLNTLEGLPGKVVLLNFRGKSGVVREILRQVSLLDDFSQAG